MYRVARGARFLSLETDHLADWTRGRLGVVVWLTAISCLAVRVCLHRAARAQVNDLVLDPAQVKEDAAAVEHSGHDRGNVVGSGHDHLVPYRRQAEVAEDSA